jgi:hypothetical protein
MELTVPFAVLAITLIAGYVVKRVMFGLLEAWAKRTLSNVDDLLIDSIRGPFMIWVLILGLHLATQFSELPRSIAGLLAKFLLILWIISLTIAASRAAVRAVRIYGRNLSSALPVTSLSQNLARLVIVSIGALTHSVAAADISLEMEIS